MDDYGDDARDRRRGRDRRSDCVEREELRDWLARHEESDRKAWDAIDAKLGRLLEAVDGGGESPGLRLRVDRIEQSARIQARIVGWLGSGAVGAVGIWLANRLLAGGSGT